MVAFDGNEQTAGFIGFNKDGSGTFTIHARERYNALIERYGSRLTPMVPKDYGVTAAATGGTFTFTAEAMVVFAKLQRWLREGK